MLGSDLKFELVPYTRGVGLDLSEGLKAKLFKHWISSSETRGLNWKDVSGFGTNSLDFVFSTGVLDYFVVEKDIPGRLRQWWRIIKPGGALCLIQSAKLSEDVVLSAMGTGFDLAVRQQYEDEDTKLWLHVYVKREDGKKTFSHQKPIPKPSVCVIRYGAIGDMFVASSILPGLKEQGYHVVLNTSDTGMELLAGHPCVDEFIPYQKDQIDTQGELDEYWLWLHKKYGRTINLCETMEVAVCSIRGSSGFTWPDAVRRKYRAANYYEFLHDIAQVPLPPKPMIPLTDRERAKARKSLKSGFNLLWVLCGSSVNKRVWQLDYVLGYPGHPGLLQEFPGLNVTFVGDESCKILEWPYQNHPRISCRSGEIGLRETAALVEAVDCVIGPETGIVNISGMSDTQTIVFLSHTSEDTLCRYWHNYQALTPEGVDCFPCYKIHYSPASCRIDEHGRAACQVGIEVETVKQAIRNVVAKQRKAA